MSGEHLLERARQARTMAYAPYSRFQVGAALETEDGSVFVGCNVENAAYGLTVCAERVAVATAVAAGHRRFRQIALSTRARLPTSPCGACRQVLAEFCDELDIHSEASGHRMHWRFSELFPARFPLDPLRGPSGQSGPDRDERIDG